MDLLRGSWRWILLVAATFWLLLAFAAPLGAERGWGIAPFIYRFFQSICHQLPERSFQWNVHSLAACHRCLGLYFGFWAGLLLLPLFGRGRRILIEHPHLLFVFVLPLLLDWFSSNTPWTRFVTGGIASLPVAVFVEAALNDFHLVHLSRRKET